MADKIKILTPEHVELEYELAGLGTRLMAFLIDALILWGTLFALYFIALIFQINVIIDPQFWSSISSAISVLISFLIFWGYFIFFELKWSGQSPGKRTMKVRVIRDSGHPIDAISSLIRNIVRFADLFVFGLGFFVMFGNEQSRRLGDFAGGTIVVKTKMDERFSGAPRIRQPISPPGEPEYLVLDAEVLSKIHLLTRQDYQAIRHFIQRAGHVEYGVAEGLACQIARPIMEKLGVGGPMTPFHFDYEQFLRELARAYERHKGDG